MSEWNKAYVTVGDLGVFPAEVATWTSWGRAVCPRFTRPVAEQIVAAVAEANTRPGHEDNERMTWDSDVIVVATPDIDDVVPEPQRLEPDRDGMYKIGAFLWKWTEVWCSGDDHAGEPDDLIPPVAIMKAIDPYHPAGPNAETTMEDRAYCQRCLQDARAIHPRAEITRLAPL